MPFVNIRLYEGHGKERKDELARRLTTAVSEVCKVPPESVWIAFEEIPPRDWYIAAKPGESVPK
jgi:4-oxalocrotonate tautomerase family enzyme